MAEMDGFRLPSVCALLSLRKGRAKTLLLTLSLAVNLYLLKLVLIGPLRRPTASGAECCQRPIERAPASGSLSQRRLREVGRLPCRLEKFGIEKNCVECETFHRQMLEDGINLTVRCGWPPDGSTTLPPAEFACHLFGVGSQTSCETCADFHRRLLNGPLQFNLTKECGWQIAATPAAECEQRARRDVSPSDGKREWTQASSDPTTASTPAQCPQTPTWCVPTVAALVIVICICILSLGWIVRDKKCNSPCLHSRGSYVVPPPTSDAA